ncbi:MAG: cation transporter [Acidimicrobiales bacterium]
MGHDHDHGTGLARASERHQGRLAAAFLVIAAFFVVEAVAGVVTNSLALLSDAGHMLTDVIESAWRWPQSSWPPASRRKQTETQNAHTFGLYRLEILAAFVNALLLFGSRGVGRGRGRSPSGH